MRHLEPEAFWGAIGDREFIKEYFRDELISSADKELVSIIYGKVNEYLFRDERLMIEAIRLTSPGIISFEGLSGIIKEIREFLKDLWWRNTYERRRNIEKLRIYKVTRIQEEIRVLRDMGLTDDEIKRLYKRLQEPLISMFHFVEERKLVNIK